MPDAPTGLGYYQRPEHLQCNRCNCKNKSHCQSKFLGLRARLCSKQHVTLLIEAFESDPAWIVFISENYV